MEKSMSNTTSNSFASTWGLSLLRIHFGVILLAHGWLKISVFTIAGTVGYFASLGLPSIVAYLTIFGEIAAGVALIAGIQTRLASILSVPILLGATFVHLGNGWLFSAEGGGWEFPASLTVIAIAIALMGSGNRLQVKFNPFDAYLPAPMRG
jgi:putative oxidoreductase|tara:strand:- start:749 stop:1204 length:456 start_codon:yes stop_codon:yes gene_type:complete